MPFPGCHATANSRSPYVVFALERVCGSLLLRVVAKGASSQRHGAVPAERHAGPHHPRRHRGHLPVVLAGPPAHIRVLFLHYPLLPAHSASDQAVGQHLTLAIILAYFLHSRGYRE